MDPSNEAAWSFLEAVWTAVASLFPAEEVHVGLDEVNQTVWGLSPQVRQWMAVHGFINVSQVCIVVIIPNSCVLKFVSLCVECRRHLSAPPPHQDPKRRLIRDVITWGSFLQDNFFQGVGKSFTNRLCNLILLFSLFWCRCLWCLFFHRA